MRKRNRRSFVQEIEQSMDETDSISSAKIKEEEEIEKDRFIKEKMDELDDRDSDSGSGVGHLFGFVMIIVSVGMILGVGVLVLDKFEPATAEPTNQTISSQTFVDVFGGLGIVGDFFPVIVTVTIFSVVLFVVIRSFGSVV